MHMSRFFFMCSVCVVCLACESPRKTVSSPEPMASAPVIPPKEDAAPAQEGGLYTYRDVQFILPKGLEVKAHDRGVFTTTSLIQASRCGPTSLDVTYVRTSLETSKRGIKSGGTRCKEFTYHKIMVIPDAPTPHTKARVMCTARGEFELGVDNVCDVIMGSLAIAAPDDRRGFSDYARTSAPVVRPREIPTAFKARGEHELFIPGREAWEMVELLDTFELGEPATPGFFISMDTPHSGEDVKIVLPNAEGEYVLHKLDDLTALSYYIMAATDSTPETLHVHVTDQQGVCQVHRLTRAQRPHVSKDHTCPKDLLKRGTWLMDINGISPAKPTSH